MIYAMIKKTTTTIAIAKTYTKSSLRLLCLYNDQKHYFSILFLFFVFIVIFLGNKSETIYISLDKYLLTSSVSSLSQTESMSPIHSSMAVGNHINYLYFMLYTCIIKK